MEICWIRIFCQLRKLLRCLMWIRMEFCFMKSGNFHLAATRYAIGSKNHNQLLYLINTDLWVHDKKGLNFTELFPLKSQIFFLINSDFDIKSVFYYFFMMIDGIGKNAEKTALLTMLTVSVLFLLFPCLKKTIIFSF